MSVHDTSSPEPKAMLQKSHSEPQCRAAPLGVQEANSRERCGIDTSAGWLLEHAGFTPGSRVAPGILCSSRRALTLTAHSDATAAAFRQALSTMAAEVHARTGITLAREPVLVARTDGPADPA
ncbi:hypothetical protein [Streptomyces cinereoruber]